MQLQIRKKANNRKAKRMSHCNEELCFIWLLELNIYELMKKCKRAGRASNGMAVNSAPNLLKVCLIL
jgi:hypothetical protein